MGNVDCSHPPPRFIDKACDVPQNGYGWVANFCTLAGPAGTKYRNSVCRDMGPEYGASREQWKCNYNDCDSRTAMKAGCCKHPARCCSVVGHGGGCRRDHFYGNPAECCLVNPICKWKVNHRWEANSDCADNKGFTCADGKNGMPDHRTLTGDSCKEVLKQYFAGDKVDINILIQRWMDPSSRGASYFLERVIHVNSNCMDTIDPSNSKLHPEGVVYASKLIEEFVTRFNKDLAPLAIPSTRWSDTYHKVQDTLYALGLRYPVIMASVLSNICSQVDVHQIGASPEVTRWCGCHLPNDAYMDYSTNFGLNKVCSPMCAGEGTIPSLDSSGNAASCQQSVCIVTDVNLTSYQSKVGNINISQLCTHCKSKDACRCVIDGVDLKIADSEIDGVVNAVQEVCTTTICTVEDPENPGQKMDIPCSGPSILYYQYMKKVRAREQRNSGFVVSLCVMLFMVTLAVILLKRM